MSVATDSTATAKKLAESIAALPPLPATAQKILSCFGDEFIDANEVADVVESDPGICARLLGLSNSSYFGLAEPVSDIREAISRVLGVDTVRSLVLAMAIQRSFNSRRCPSFSAERFWMQSLQTAECSKRLAAKDKSADATVRDLAYSTGLCHNLGLMALAHMEPDHTNAALRIHEAEGVPGRLTAIFVRELATDHRIMTAELSRLWSLPELMVNAYHYRAFPELSDDDRLGQIITAGAAAVSNAALEEDQQIDLGPCAEKMGMAADELQELAFFGERQTDKIRSLSSNMTC